MAETPTLALFLESFELFRDPILVSAAAGAVLGYLGVFVVLRRMVFVAAALSQAAGAGVALAFYAQIHYRMSTALADPRLGALGLTVLTGWILGGSGKRLISRDGQLALAYLLGASGALLLGTRISQEAHDIQAILFGTGVLVSESDTHWVLVSGALIMLWQLWWRRGFLFASLDPEGARVRGLPVRLLDGALMLMVAVFVSVATHALGALPVFAFSVLPALAAVAVAASPAGALAIAAILGAVAGAGGYMLAFFMQFPVGASQAGVAGMAVLAALTLRRLMPSARGSLRSEQAAT